VSNEAILEVHFDSGSQPLVWLMVNLFYRIVSYINESLYNPTYQTSPFKC